MGLFAHEKALQLSERAIERISGGREMTTLIIATLIATLVAVRKITKLKHDNTN
jgi:hypothetical protein